jgi:hypothetical protein
MRGAQMIMTVDNGIRHMPVSIGRMRWGSRCWLPITICRVKPCLPPRQSLTQPARL